MSRTEQALEATTDELERKNEQIMQLNDDLNKTEVEVMQLKGQLQRSERVSYHMAERLDNVQHMHDELNELCAKQLEDIGKLIKKLEGQKAYIARLEAIRIEPSIEETKTELHKANEYIYKLQEEVTGQHNLIQAKNKNIRSLTLCVERAQRALRGEL